MNKRQIQPIQIWSESGSITVDALFLKDFCHYHFDGGGGKTSYTLGDYQTDYDNIYGSLDIPSSIVQQWGSDDSIIWEYVANALGLILI